jgi:hypothetical protein
MKITRQTPTCLEVQYLPILNWTVCAIIAILSIHGIVTFNANPLWTFFWFLLLVGCIYGGLVWFKIITCIAQQSTQTLTICQRNLVKTQLQQQRFFKEVSAIEIREKYSKNGKYYLAYLICVSGQTIFMGRGRKGNLEYTLKRLAQFIGCRYHFMPLQRGFFSWF